MFTSFREFERARSCYRTLVNSSLWEPFEELPARSDSVGQLPHRLGSQG